MQRFASLAVLAVLAGCYEYRPIETAPPMGEMVSLQISDQGRVNLAQRFGPGLAEVQGRLVEAPPSEFVLDVFKVSQVSGQSTLWAGETTRIDRSFVNGIKGRRISPLRTGLLSVAAGGVLYFLVNRGLHGSFTGGREPEPEPPPISNRVPGIRIGF